MTTLSGDLTRPSGSRRDLSDAPDFAQQAHPFYEIVSAEWATRWPAEELWVATRAIPEDT